MNDVIIKLWTKKSTTEVNLNILDHENIVIDQITFALRDSSSQGIICIVW